MGRIDPSIAIAEETRRFPRLVVDLPVFRRVGTRFVNERARDVSAGGLALATQELLRPGTVVEIVLAAPDGSLEVPMQAQVVYTRSTDAGSPYIAGLKVSQVDARVVPTFQSLLLREMAVSRGRRRRARIEFGGEALWIPPGSTALGRTVTVVNIGFGGALLRGPDLPEAGVPVQLTLNAPGTASLAAVAAACVWCRHAPEADYAGVRFHGDTADREFIAKVLRGVLFSRRKGVVPRSGIAPGIRVGDFAVEALIGRGGMCEVYRGRGLVGPLAGTAVALKRLLPPSAALPGVVDRFETEGDLGRMLEHPGVVRIHTEVVFGAEHWLAMELVEGAALGAVLSAFEHAHQRPPVDAVVSVAIELLGVLAYCHAFKSPSGRDLGVVHGDVTPSNVLLTRDGVVKLTDFGMASTALPEGGDLPGAPAKLAYLAPELFRDRAPPTPLVDVYQVGVVLYEALTGIRPFKGDSPDEVCKVVERGPMPPARLNPHVPAALERLVLQSLSAQPKKRPESAGVFAQALKDAVPCFTGEVGKRVRARLVEQAEALDRQIPQT